MSERTVPATLALTLSPVCCIVLPVLCCIRAWPASKLQLQLRLSSSSGRIHIGAQSSAHASTRREELEAERMKRNETEREERSVWHLRGISVTSEVYRTVRTCEFRVRARLGVFWFSVLLLLFGVEFDRALACGVRGTPEVTARGR